MRCLTSFQLDKYVTLELIILRVLMFVIFIISCKAQNLMLERVVALTCVYAHRRAIPMFITTTAPEPSLRPCVHEISTAILASLRHLCKVYSHVGKIQY